MASQITDEVTTTTTTTKSVDAVTPAPPRSRSTCCRRCRSALKALLATSSVDDSHLLRAATWRMFVRTPRLDGVDAGDVKRRPEVSRTDGGSGRSSTTSVRKHINSVFGPWTVDTRAPAAVHVEKLRHKARSVTDGDACFQVGGGGGKEAKCVRRHCRINGKTVDDFVMWEGDDVRGDELERPQSDCYGGAGRIDSETDGSTTDLRERRRGCVSVCSDGQSARRSTSLPAIRHLWGARSRNAFEKLCEFEAHASAAAAAAAAAPPPSSSSKQTKSDSSVEERFERSVLVALDREPFDGELLGLRVRCSPRTRCRRQLRLQSIVEGLQTRPDFVDCIGEDSTVSLSQLLEVGLDVVGRPARNGQNAVAVAAYDRRIKVQHLGRVGRSQQQQQPLTSIIATESTVKPAMSPAAGDLTSLLYLNLDRESAILANDNRSLGISPETEVDRLQTRQLLARFAAANAPTTDCQQIDSRRKQYVCLSTPCQPVTKSTTAAAAAAVQRQ